MSKLVHNFVISSHMCRSYRFSLKREMLTFSSGKTLASDCASGSTTKEMKPTCELAREYVYRSVSGVSGRPISRSLSPWLKNSRRRQSSHFSDTFIGRHSLDISDVFMSILINC